MGRTSIVITGSSRGIGYGLAESFLQHGCCVTLNGRSADSLARAAGELANRHGPESIAYHAGDVTRTSDLEELWTAAAAEFGHVDIWINNAGVGHPLQMVWDLPEKTVEQVLDIDIRGTVLGSRVAISYMLEQGFGHVYNMEGFGSDGRLRAGLSVYGTTKAAVHYLTQSLARELRSTPVKVSSLSPGMVMTRFILDQYRDDPEGLERAKSIFNTIADRPETVAPWLARRVLSNTKSGRVIKWLTAPKIFWRFATGWMRTRDLFSG